MLLVHSAGPGVTIQDLGWHGHMALGLSRGGAADRRALYEAAALLGSAPDLAVIEMAGFGGVFEASAPMHIALVGAPMQADLDGVPVIWNAVMALAPGQRLRIGAARSGVYGYLAVAGGFQTRQMLGARSTLRAAGLGHVIAPGDQLPVGPAGPNNRAGLHLVPEARFDGGRVRILPSAQTELFDAETRTRFEGTTFTRDPKGNRQGVKLTQPDAGFASAAGLSVLSEPILPGDIQITGDGTPFVLLSDCQTTGGYPRIGSVLPCDLPRVAQAAPGAEIQFEFISRTAAQEAETRAHAETAGLGRRCVPLVRAPGDVDLMGLQLISGAITGFEEKDTE